MSFVRGQEKFWIIQISTKCVKSASKIYGFAIIFLTQDPVFVTQDREKNTLYLIGFCFTNLMIAIHGRSSIHITLYTAVQ